MVMKTVFILISVLPIIIFSCKKSTEQYFSGAVDRGINDCIGSTGFVYIVKYINQRNEIDSLSTLTLPAQFELSGVRIKFQI
jgi:hypothetical protein